MKREYEMDGAQKGESCRSCGCPYGRGEQVMVMVDHPHHVYCGKKCAEQDEK